MVYLECTLVCSHLACLCSAFFVFSLQALPLFLIPVSIAFHPSPIGLSEHIIFIKNHIYRKPNLVLFQQQSSRERLSDEDVQRGGIVGVKYTWSLIFLDRDIAEFCVTGQRNGHMRYMLSLLFSLLHNVKRLVQTRYGLTHQWQNGCVTFKAWK